MLSVQGKFYFLSYLWTKLMENCKAMIPSIHLNLHIFISTVHNIFMKIAKIQNITFLFFIRFLNINLRSLFCLKIFFFLLKLIKTWIGFLLSNRSRDKLYLIICIFWIMKLCEINLISEICSCSPWAETPKLTNGYHLGGQILVMIYWFSARLDVSSSQFGTLVW